MKIKHCDDSEKVRLNFTDDQFYKANNKNSKSTGILKNKLKRNSTS